MADEDPAKPAPEGSSDKKTTDSTVKAARITLLGVLITAVLSLVGVITAAIINARAQAAKPVTERNSATSAPSDASAPSVVTSLSATSSPRVVQPTSPRIESTTRRTAPVVVDGLAIIPAIPGERINFETFDHGPDLVDWHALVGKASDGSPILKANSTRPIGFGMIGNNPANIGNCTDGLRLARRTEFPLVEREKYPACIGLENGAKTALRYRPPQEPASPGFIEVDKL